MKFLYALILMTFGFANFAYAAEQIAGIQLVKLSEQGHTHLGATEPIACAENYELNTGCFRWTPVDKDVAKQCYRSGMVGLHHNFPSPKQVWVSDWKGDYLFMVNYYGSPPSVKPEAKTIEINKDGFYALVYGVKIDCHSSRQNNDMLFENITQSIMHSLPFSDDQKSRIRSDCLLAEKALGSGGLPNRGTVDRHFYCLETDTLAEAEAIAESYVMALETNSNEIKTQHEFSSPKWNWTSGRIIKNRLAYTNMTSASARVAVASEEQITATYLSMGIEREAAKGRATTLFAIDVMFNGERKGR